MPSKPYRVDGEPVSASRLIELAASVNKKFDRDWLKCTSVAANILRENGSVVDNNPEASAKPEG